MPRGHRGTHRRLLDSLDGLDLGLDRLGLGGEAAAH